MKNQERSRVTASSSAATIFAQSSDPQESPALIRPETPGQVTETNEILGFAREIFGCIFE